MADEKDRTLYCGNLSEQVTEDILYELFLQAGPLENVHIPKDKEGKPRKFAFIRFKHPISVPYTIALMNGIYLYGKPLNLDPRAGSATEHNPYLEKLRQYRQSFHQNAVANRNYNNTNLREPYDDQSHRYDSRRSRPESQRNYNQWNMNVYPSQSPHYNVGMPVVYPVQGRFAAPQVEYPYGNRGNRQRNHR